MGGDILKASTEGGRCVTAQTGLKSNIIDKTYLKNKNALVQSIYGGHPDGEKRTLSQITLSEGWKNQNPEEESVICGPDGQVVTPIVSVTSLVTDKVSVAQPAVGDMIRPGMEGGGCVNAQTGSKRNIVQAEVKFITTSMFRRGNRNKAMLIREKRKRQKQ